MKNCNHRSLALAISAVLSTGASFSNNAIGAQLEEVVVTAQRRAEAMQDVPVAVSAYSAEFIEKARLVDISDIVATTPSVSFTPFSQVDPQLFIRGIGSSDDGAGGDPSVVVFQDDVVFARASGAAVAMFDLERIEVLRGPQGTLYGKNAVGGALHMITRDPGSEFGGYVGVTAFGDHGRFESEGAVNLPLTDKLAARVAFSTKQSDGYNYSLTTGRDVDGEDNTSARVKLLYQPSDSFSARLTINTAKDDVYGNTRKPIPDGSFAKNAGAVDIHPNPRVRQPADDGYLKRDITGVDLKLDWSLGMGTLTSITAQRTVDIDWFQDLSGLPVPPARLQTQNIWREKTDQFSQEFRYEFTANNDKLNGMVGFFYLKEDTDREEEFRRAFFAIPGNPPGQTPARSNPVFNQDNSTESKALFAQFNYQFTDKLGVTLGTRWTEDDKTIDLAVEDLSNGALPSLAPATELYDIRNSETWDEITSSLSINYRLNEDALVYFRAAEGYKSGGFQTAPASATSASVSYEPEFAMTYEIGLKSEWLDNRLRLNLAAFQNDYEDLQVLQLVEAVPGNVATLVLVTDNAATAEITGLELELTAAVSDSLTVGASYSNLDAEFTDYTTNTGADLSGFKLRRTPEDSSSIYLEQTLQLGSGETLARIEYLSKGDQFFENDNRAVSFEPSYDLLNASVRYTSADDAWSVTLWGKNLTDELYRSSSISVADSGFSRVGAPKTWGLSFRYNFGEN
ncbi:TonB-dependent receptor [Aequoribacter fuscus]|uniref:TonB-dependent receptor n=1 Tax=Aequoribacter fuscus TaxID=2518989 RepID=F3L5T7_9GAMM|nr:TonB-dependent receptor [Aequoribacter fuscus]EGG28308.1 TonB-dependent receptor [Aequoribacter fuscus]QHJ87542.1 TonB-dependent receptor [Aequoribacter fuscus]